jgi:hypothetical protein
MRSNSPPAANSAAFETPAYPAGAQKRIEYSRVCDVIPGVKTKSIFPGIFKLVALLVAAASSVSCVTTYDASGRPVQTVDPAVAVAGAAAAGLAGYAIANNNNHNHGYYHGGYYAPRPYYPRTYGGYQPRYYRR